MTGSDSIVVVMESGSSVFLYEYELIEAGFIVGNFRMDVPIELSTESVEFSFPLQIVMGSDIEGVGYRRHAEASRLQPRGGSLVSPASHKVGAGVSSHQCETPSPKKI